MKKITLLAIIYFAFLSFVTVGRADNGKFELTLKNASDQIIIYNISEIVNLDEFNRALERKKNEVPDDNMNGVMKFWDKNWNKNIKMATELAGGYLDPGITHDFNDFGGMKNYYIEIAFEYRSNVFIKGISLIIGQSIKKASIIWQKNGSWTVTFE